MRAECICPMRAQVALMAGAAVVVRGGRLSIGGRVLIGGKGKEFVFKSQASAAAWAARVKKTGERNLATARRNDAAWVRRKGQELAAMAGRLMDSAERMQDVEKMGAILSEADLCFERIEGL